MGDSKKGEKLGSKNYHLGVNSVKYQLRVKVDFLTILKKMAYLQHYC